MVAYSHGKFNYRSPKKDDGLRREGRSPSCSLLIILRGRRGKEPHPAKADAGALFALEEGELQLGADIDIRQTEVVIVVLIGRSHDPAPVFESEEGGEVHPAPHLVVEGRTKDALLVDEAVVGKNEVRAVHLIV